MSIAEAIQQIEQEEQATLPASFPFLEIRPDLAPYQQSYLADLQDFHTKAVSRGAEMDSFGFELFTRHIEGVQSGLILFAGGPNLGKTAAMIQIAWSMPQLGNYFSVFHTLDDNTRTVIPRVCAVSTRTPMAIFSSPLRHVHVPEYREAYVRGLQNLAEASDRFILRDQRSGSDVEGIGEHLEQLAEMLHQQGSDRKLALFIDNFHDLTTRDKHAMQNNNDRYGTIAEYLKRLVNVMDIPIFCTAEVTKIGTRRPRLEDIRETGNIGYEANLVIGIYNEVGLLKEASNIYYRNREDGPKLPVVEMDILKNKFSSYKGRLFYQFVPEMSYLHECDEELQAYYESRVQA